MIRLLKICLMGEYRDTQPLKNEKKEGKSSWWWLGPKRVLCTKRGAPFHYGICLQFTGFACGDIYAALQRESHQGLLHIKRFLFSQLFFSAVLSRDDSDRHAPTNRAVQYACVTPFFSSPPSEKRENVYHILESPTSLAGAAITFFLVFFGVCLGQDSFPKVVAMVLTTFGNSVEDSLRFHALQALTERA